MFVLITRQRLHQPMYHLIFSLAYSDFITSLIGQIAYTTEVTFMDTTSCTLDKIIASLNGGSFITSLMLMCMISRDRWLHVAKGLRYNEYTSNKQVMKISVACWLIGLSVSLPYCFEVSCMQVVSMFGFVLIAISCFIAICIITVKVLRLVKSHFDEIENNRQDDDSVNAVHGTRLQQKKERAKVERSVNRSIIAVIVVYFVSWFPGIIIITIIAVQSLLNKDSILKLRTAFVWTVTMSYINGAINPFIYAYRCDSIGRDIRDFVLNIKTKVFPR